jgi:hypothetical protein
MSKQTLFRHQRRIESFHKFTTSGERCNRDRFSYLQAHSYANPFTVKLVKGPAMRPVAMKPPAPVNQPRGASRKKNPQG